MIFRNVIWVKRQIWCSCSFDDTPWHDWVPSERRKNDIGSEDNHDDEKDMGDGNDDNGDSHAGHGIWTMVEEDVYGNYVDHEKAVKDDLSTTWT